MFGLWEIQLGKRHQDIVINEKNPRITITKDAYDSLLKEKIDTIRPEYEYYVEGTKTQPITIPASEIPANEGVVRVEWGDDVTNKTTHKYYDYLLDPEPKRVFMTKKELREHRLYVFCRFLIAVGSILLSYSIVRGLVYYFSL